MQAYNYSDLKNKAIREQSSEAFLDKTISDESYGNILAHYPSSLFTPNYFIRIALMLLTIIAVSFSALLLTLVLSVGSNASSMMLSFFLALLTYAALEFLVKKKHYYNAGVDNMLMCLSVMFLVSTIVIIEVRDAYLVGSFVAMVFSLWLCIRFTDAFMACVSYVSAFLFTFFLVLKFGSSARLIAPFVMMIFSGGIYVLMTKLLQREKFWVYNFSFKTVIALTLLTFYASANFFVVSVGMVTLTPNGKGVLSLGWLFWILTFAIPVVYITYGVLKRNLSFIRIGLALTAVSILTFRFFFAILPGEVAMLIAGIILAAVSYFLSKYLKVAKHGFSFDHNARPPKELLNAQSVIIAQAFGRKTEAHTKSVEFGGGSFGGGGAGSNY